MFGTSFENLDIGIKLDTGAYGTAIFAPRLENMNKGVYLMSGSDHTGIFQLYASVVSTRLDAAAGIDPGQEYKEFGY